MPVEGSPGVVAHDAGAGGAGPESAVRARSRHETACSVEGCDRAASKRGRCEPHYRHALKHGEISVLPILDPTERFWSKVDKTDSCWMWTGAPSARGYAIFATGGQTYRASRYVYEEVVGPIPDGMQLDHLCHTRDLSCPGGPSCPHRRCVNPAHLEPVTGRENTLRGRSPSAVNNLKTECKYGHEFTDANTRIRPGGDRECRECARLAHRRGYEAAKNRNPSNIVDAAIADLERLRDERRQQEEADRLATDVRRMRGSRWGAR